MSMDWEPNSTKIHIIDDVQMKKLNDLMSDENKVNVEAIIKLLSVIYEKNCEIYDVKKTNSRYCMDISGIKYELCLQRNDNPKGPATGQKYALAHQPTYQWKRNNTQYGKYLNPYTKEDTLIDIKLTKIQVLTLEVYEDNIQMILMLNNNNIIHLIVFTFPITTLIGYYQPPIIDCHTEECVPASCKCQCHSPMWYDRWCNSCFKEQYKAEFMYKIIFRHNDFKLSMTSFFEQIRNSKKINVKLYKSVHKLKTITMEDYHRHFEHALHAKVKQLEAEYELVKRFLSEHANIDDKPTNGALNNLLTAHKYFAKDDSVVEDVTVHTYSNKGTNSVDELD